MINIIKSLNYSARRDTVIWLTIITLLISPLCALYLSGMINPDLGSEFTSSMYFASKLMGTVFTFMTFGIMILTCKLMAGDAGDKTINYEFMAGHSRKRIFIGRTIAAFLWGAVLVFIIMILPLGYLTLIYGWGPETSVNGVLFRCFLALFPIIRFTALTLMIASVSRGAGKGIALNYALYMVTAMVASVIQEVLEKDIVYPFSMTNVAALLSTTNSRNVVIDGKTITVFDTAVPGDMMWKTIGVSLLCAVIYLIIAYINFIKTDRD